MRKYFRMDANNNLRFQIINTLSENERLISRLYELYSGKIIQKKDFFLRLSENEQIHAQWIASLYVDIQMERLSFKDTRFDLPRIKEFSDLIKRFITEATKSEMNYFDMLSISLKVEDSLLENRFFVVFDTDETRLRMVLKDLQDATEKHRIAVIEELDKEKIRRNIND